VFIRVIGAGQLGAPLHLLDGHFVERPISAQSYLRGCYRAGLGQVADDLQNCPGAQVMICSRKKYSFEMTAFE